MITLAIEFSTTLSGIAVLDDGQVVLEREWERDRRRPQDLFTGIYDLVAGGSLDLARVGLLAAGTGPGAFSGLRTAIALAQALGMSGGKPVFGVASAGALAWETMTAFSRDTVLVCGDARRNELWAGRFRLSGGLPVQDGTWTVARADELAGAVGDPGSVWVTADWTRIGNDLDRICPAGCLLIREPRYPRAGAVGRLAYERQKTGAGSEPLTPIYLHPPVAMPAPG